MNKKILSLILMCSLGFASISAQEIVIKKKDGSAQTVGETLYFKQKGAAAKRSVTYEQKNTLFDIDVLVGIRFHLGTGTRD